MSKFLYPIYNLPNEYKQDLDVRELPLYMKWWLYNHYKVNHGALSDILIGTHFTLIDTLKRKFKIFEIQGNSTQVQLTGKNLYNKDSSQIENNKWISSGNVENSSSSYIVSDYMKIKASTQYIVSGLTNSGNNPSYCFYDESKNYISGATHSLRTSYSFTTPENAYYIRDSIAKVDMDTYQLEEGTTATSYEQYCRTEYQVLILRINKIYTM